MVMADDSRERKRERRKRRKRLERRSQQRKSRPVTVPPDPAPLPQDTPAADGKKQDKKIEEKDITGLKYFDKLGPLLERLHDDACERDTAGNRELHFDQYCLLILLYLFKSKPANLCAS